MEFSCELSRKNNGGGDGGVSTGKVVESGRWREVYFVLC